MSIFDTGITYNNLYYERKIIVADKIKVEENSSKARIYYERAMLEKERGVIRKEIYHLNNALSFITASLSREPNNKTYITEQKLIQAYIEQLRV